MKINSIPLPLNGIAQKYRSILDRTLPYVLTFPANLSQYDLSPWGYKIPTQNIFSCVDATKAIFFDLLQSLDQLAFGPVGMPMDKWVFFDCGEMPGGVCGFGLYAKDLSDSEKEFFKIDRLVAKSKGNDIHSQNLNIDELFVPISMYIAIPMATPSAWFGHNLSSANSVLGSSFQGLGLLTKVLALKVFNIHTIYGATQWDSKSLNIHLQISDMEMMSAYTPAHSFCNTITYKSFYDDEILLSALSGEKRESKNYDQLVDVMDESAISTLQIRIASGDKFIINGRPVYRDGKTFLPIKTLVTR
ncbi:MAG: hypothetical protein HQK53_09925 [Oligoflexia bacterium]|nr:hypothetical protein [Oligoflexia bacterium]